MSDYVSYTRRCCVVGLADPVSGVSLVGDAGCRSGSALAPLITAWVLR